MKEYAIIVNNVGATQAHERECSEAQNRGKKLLYNTGSSTWCSVTT